MYPSSGKWILTLFTAGNNGIHCYRFGDPGVREAAYRIVPGQQHVQLVRYAEAVNRTISHQKARESWVLPSKRLCTL